MADDQFRGNMPVPLSPRLDGCCHSKWWLGGMI